MKGFASVAAMLLLMLTQNSWQKPMYDTEEISSSTLQTSEKQLDTSNSQQDVKRHSEGTFSSDYSKYIDNKRAKEFVQWLLNAEGNSSKSKRHAEGTYTSDVDSLSDYFKAKRFVDSLAGYGRHQNGGISKRSIESTISEESYKNGLDSFLEVKAAKDFIDWLMNGRGRREYPEDGKENLNEVISEDLDRRHGDGSFSSELADILDSMAANDFLKWLLNSLANQTSSTLQTSEKQLDTSNSQQDVKRHSEGTFSSDYSKYIDNKRAKEFVQWLLNAEGNSSKSKRHAEGTYTSDVDSLSDYFKAKRFVDSLAGYGRHQNGGISKRSIESTISEESYKNGLDSFLEVKAAKDFIDWLMNGRGRREYPEDGKENLNEVISEDLDRRHADGSFTSEISDILDSMAASDFLKWLLNSQAIQKRDS